MLEMYFKKGGEWVGPTQPRSSLRTNLSAVFAVLDKALDGRATSSETSSRSRTRFTCPTSSTCTPPARFVDREVCERGPLVEGHLRAQIVGRRDDAEGLSAHGTRPGQRRRCRRARSPEHAAVQLSVRKSRRVPLGAPCPEAFGLRRLPRPGRLRPGAGGRFRFRCPCRASCRRDLPSRGYRRRRVRTGNPRVRRQLRRSPGCPSRAPRVRSPAPCRACHRRWSASCSACELPGRNISQIR